MNNISRKILIASLVACIICLCCSVWMASVLKDSQSWFIVLFFAVATAWLGWNVFRGAGKDE